MVALVDEPMTTEHHLLSNTAQVSSRLVRLSPTIHVNNMEWKIQKKKNKKNSSYDNLVIKHGFNKIMPELHNEFL